jgi:hypothetical protein
MMPSQKIVAVILLILFVSYISIPIYNQIASKAKTKQEFIELCISATSATYNDNDNACGCAWNKALSEYGYDKIEKQMRYNGSVDPADLATWVLDCKS